MHQPMPKVKSNHPITTCINQQDQVRDNLAWTFWKAQCQLVELNLRLAHIKKTLKEKTFKK